MVAEVLTHARQVLDHRHSHFLQMSRRADAGEHQNLRGGHGPGAQDHLVAFNGECLAAALDLDAAGAGAIEQDPAHQHVAADGEVQPVAVVGDIGERGAHPHAVGVVHRQRADAAGIGVVVVVDLGIPRRHGRYVERLRQRQPGLALVAAHRHRAVEAVEVVYYVGVGFQLAEIRQALDEGPLVIAPLGPTVVVLGNAAQEHLAVDGAGAADHLATRHHHVLGAGRAALAGE